MNDNVIQTPQLALSVAAAAAAISISRSQMYQEIAEGKITARKVGSRTLIEVDELRRFLAAQPVANLAGAAA